jgi:hypothetical protein
LRIKPHRLSERRWETVAAREPSEVDLRECERAATEIGDCKPQDATVPDLTHVA